MKPSNFSICGDCGEFISSNSKECVKCGSLIPHDEKQKLDSINNIYKSIVPPATLYEDLYNMYLYVFYSTIVVALVFFATFSFTFQLGSSSYIKSLDSKTLTYLSFLFILTPLYIISIVKYHKIFNKHNLKNEFNICKNNLSLYLSKLKVYIKETKKGVIDKNKVSDILFEHKEIFYSYGSQSFRKLLKKQYFIRFYVKFISFYPSVIAILSINIIIENFGGYQTSILGELMMFLLVITIFIINYFVNSIFIYNKLNCILSTKAISSIDKLLIKHIESIKT